jgi:CBS domain-containing protein
VSTLSDFLSSAKDDLDHGRPRQLSVRGLLEQWGAKRRGAVIVAQVNHDLTAAGLATVPPFEDVVWIDDEVSLVKVVAGQTTVPTASEPDTGVASDIGDSGVLRVRQIKAAHGPLERVSPQDTLERAQSLMLEKNYSQLAVLSGERELRGFVSWESIAKALIVSRDCTLDNVVLPADPPLRLSDDLLSNVPRIVDKGFLFVEGTDRRISGIVTVADLAEEFEESARPFFLVGDIERRLRRIVERIPPELGPPAETDEGEEGVSGSSSPEDMTFGDYLRLFEQPAVWSSFGWRIDRVAFVHQLDRIREIRNDVMHFSADPLDEKQAEALRRFVETLQVLSPVV